MTKYKIRIRMNGHGTFFSYEFEAPTNEYALNHLDAIRASGYQRVSDSGEVEFLPPL